ncbi:MAG: hypothetical protein K1X78_01045 [Verrucomicrobiaceae bacterium]|nr:hypothetical protein [Verrucomicrobiaceae bacterium]
MNLLFRLSLLIGVTACCAASDQAALSITPRLKVEILTANWGDVTVHVTNESSTDVVLWEDWNSWGFYNFQFEVISSSSLTPFAIRRKETGWTGNFPSFKKLEAHAVKEFRADFANGQWDVPASLLTIGGKWKVSAIYLIRETGEAKKYGVPIGIWMSSAVEMPSPDASAVEAFIHPQSVTSKPKKRKTGKK